MVKYKLLTRPTTSNWPNVPRHFKLGFALILFITVTAFFVFGRSRSFRLTKIYNIQQAFANIFNLEIELMKKNENSNDDEWSPVVDLDGHVFSAYLDIRPEVIDHYSQGKNEIIWSLLRIIAILPTKIDEKIVECVCKYGNEKEGYTEKRRPAVSVKAINDHLSLKYAAFFVICDLASTEIVDYDRIFNETQLPESVAIGLGRNKELKFIDVHYPMMGFKQLYGPANNFMAICVPVLHHSFDRPLDLVEFIEYYLQLGATHFTFYNASVTSEVSRVLEYYKNQNIATVLSWKLPSNYIFEKTLRFGGLLAGINDCLYRNAFHENYEYIGIFGTDEFLVPRKHENFVDLIDYLDPPKNDGDGRYASFIFRNVYFYTMYENDIRYKDPIPYLYTQAKTWRLAQPDNAGDRSRYIVRGHDAVELGNYRAVELREGSSTFTNPFQEITADTEVALSHQYAPCEAEDTGCYLKQIVIDRTAHKFTDILGNTVASACDKIFGSAGCSFYKKQTFA